MRECVQETHSCLLCKVTCDVGSKTSDPGPSIDCFWRWRKPADRTERAERAEREEREERAERADRADGAEQT